MKDIFTYIIEILTGSAIFAILYEYWLSKRSPFLFQRRYLLGTVILAMVIPMLNIPLFPVTANTGFEILPVPEAQIITVHTAIRTVDWKTIILLVYGITVVAGVVFTIINAAKINRLKKRAEKSKTDGIAVYTSELVKSPFAYTNSIYIGKDFTEYERGLIITHEINHIRHKHPQERLLMNLMCIVCFFNPFVWYVARKLSEVHEFETDRNVIDTGYDLRDYQKLILKQILGYCPEITNGLNNSLTKKRLIMMTINNKPGNAIVHTIVSICVIAVLILSFGCGEKKTPAPVPEITATPETVIESEADTTEATLTNEAQNDSDVSEINETKPVKDSIKFVVPHVVEKPKVKDSGIPAKFPGGDKALYQFMSDNLQYPQSAVDEGIKGNVHVSFTVNKDGSISNVEITKSLREDCDNAVLEIFNKMPKWEPASDNGEPISSIFTLPITFATKN